MAELRIGHEQVTFKISGFWADEGTIKFSATNTNLTKQQKKSLTGNLPVVIIGNDGKKIVATWHDDFTEPFREVRETKLFDGQPVTVDMTLKIDYITVRPS